MAERPVSGTSRGERGFSLLEVLVGSFVLVVALLGHVSSTLVQHRLTVEEGVRGEVLQVIRRVMERLRSDDDWPTLYERIATIQKKGAPASGSAVVLADGRSAYTLQTYYADLVVPSELADMRLRLEVPLHTPDEDPKGKALGKLKQDILREDALDARFGLPADLNGDGMIDAESHDADYVALPVQAVFHWTPPGEAACEVRIATWLRGTR